MLTERAHLAPASDSFHSNCRMEGDVLPTVIKAGWLNKKGEYIQTWRKRFFVLYSDGAFNGYREEPTSEMIQYSNGKFENTFTVKNSAVIAPGDSTKFVVRCGQRANGENLGNNFVERNFQAKSEVERDSWVNAIKAVNEQPADIHDRFSDMEIDEPDEYMSRLAQPQLYKKKYTLDDFEKLKLVGKGTFGNVILVYEKSDPNKTRKALKLIDKQLIRQKDETEHTRNESKVLSITNHPFLIKLHCAFTTSKSLCLVMEFAAGGEIYTHLARCNSFPISRCRFYGAEIVSAFAYLHSKNIVYRDLKLENLLLDKDGHIKLTDFGLCKILNSEGTTNTFCGTPEYLAPEVIDDNIYGMSVDWWSFGVVLHEMIVGRLPFPQWENHEDLYDAICNDNLSELPPRVPPDAGNLLRQLLRKRPEDRLGFRTDATEVMEHPFFATINFAALERKEIQPEFVPNIRDEDDVQHFDLEFTQQSFTRLLPAGGASITSHDDTGDFPEFSYNNDLRSSQDPIMT